jgi:hypothetical protein
MSECCSNCDAVETEARADGRIASNDVAVSMQELRDIWDMAREDGEVCNGSTGRTLAERYGDRLYHVTGVGWFVRR